MVQGLMQFLDRTKWTFDLALAAGGDALAVLACRDVRHDPDAKTGHDVLEDPAAGDRAVVHIDRLGDALERHLVFRLWRHGVEEEAQRGLCVLAIDAAVFLVGRAAPVIDDAEQHERGIAATGCGPKWLLHLLQVGGTHVELPQLVGSSRLKPHGRRRTGDPLVVDPQSPEVAVDGRLA
jgi:hypothetical protein